MNGSNLCATEAYPVKAGRMHGININPCLNGYIINVGCQSVVFARGDETKMADEVAAYLKDPQGVAERYLSAATGAPVV